MISLLEHGWRQGWSDRPALDPLAMIAAARESTGLCNFGEEDDGWRPRLNLLADALQQEAGLNALGLTIAYGQIVAALSNRLRAASLWHRHPEIADVPMTAPIIIVGQMRSGSTLMQRLLACDPAFTFTRFFESWNPVPRWDWLPFDDRRWRSRMALSLAHWLNPKFAAIHPTQATDADEEIGLHNISLYGAAFEAQWRIPSFARHGEASDSRPVYRQFRRHLQTIHWLRRDRTDKPWIMKLPQFAQDLEAVLDIFPDARLIVLQRDPVEIVGSSASLVRNQMALQSDRVDDRWIGREWLHKVALREERMAQALVRHSDAALVAYSAMQADWQGEVHRLYHTMGWSLTPAVLDRMTSFMQQPRHGRLSGHQYNISDFGLTEAQIRNTMMGLSQAA
ncbi:sulfotransferase family protein [Croceibacterium xixiisoli]|uniref:sulfotransferase family protein n=1 Tax=Croceibacterium xixiisoli TaxID=1476466 RepID=UPI00136C0D61|nr:sulfotransferase [Croceibacterium xixiisoli]